MTTVTTSDNVVDDYLQHLELERGLSPNSLAAYRRDIGEFKRFFKLSDDYNIPHRAVSEYLTRLNGLNRKPSSIARKTSSLRGFYKYLHENELIRDNPFEYARVPRISRYHPDYLSVSEIEKILSQPDLGTKKGIRDKAIMEMLYGAGMRISELINLKMSAVYDEIGFVKITGKANKERLVPYGTHAKAAVEKYLTEIREKIRSIVDDDILFLSGRNRKFSRVGIWKIVRKYALMTGVGKSVTPHIFRHSFATHMIEGGADLRTVQELLGHASITTTQIYTQVDKEYLLSIHREYHPREKKSAGRGD
jgi:integrase/recombinase XerD